MRADTAELAAVVREFQSWTISTEPVLWGFPQMLHETAYTLDGFAFQDDLLKLECKEQGAVLSVWSPRGVAMKEWGLSIADAQRVRWDWLVYGKADAPPMSYFKEFWRTEEDISGKSNSHWSGRDVERLVSKTKAAVMWMGDRVITAGL